MEIALWLDPYRIFLKCLTINFDSYVWQSSYHINISYRRHYVSYSTMQGEMTPMVATDCFHRVYERTFYEF